ncbi:unnamed protein product [Camellia sinensis]
MGIYGGAWSIIGALGRHRKKKFVRIEKDGVPATPLKVWMVGYSKDNKPSADRVVEVMHYRKRNAWALTAVAAVVFVAGASAVAAA